MKRINVLNESKFERMTPAEMNYAKGGFCISCKKRARKIELGGKATIKYEGVSVEIS